MDPKNNEADASSDITIKTIWNASFIFLMIVSFITAMCFNMVYITISKYSKGITDSLTIVGFLSGMFSIAALVIRPFAGLTSDLFNKKLLSIISNVIIGISVLGYAFSHNIPGLFFFRILHGAAFGIGSTVNIALATKFIPKSRMGEGLGIYGLGQVVAQVISPNLGLYIQNNYGFQTFFLLLSLLSFTGAALLMFLHYPHQKNIGKKITSKITLHSLIAKEVIVYAAIGGIFSFSNGIVSSFLILTAEERRIENIGLFFSVGTVVLFILRIFVGRIVDKKGLTLVVNIALVITAVSMGLIGFSYTLGLLLIASILKSLGQGSGQISLQTDCIKGVDPSRVGIATSTFYIGADIGQGIGPMIGGAISSQFNYTVLFLFCAFLMLVAMLFFNLYQQRKVPPVIAECIT